jgi:EAL domain-containing protein (putative c-di-GMP-specific phosphodiesterase class I)
LYYQPIISLSTKKIIGFEALTRWLHPTKGLVLPDEFIFLAEETGLIIPMGLWVLEEACRQAARWDSMLDNGPRITVNVNVSAQQFIEKNFVATVRNALAKVQLEGSRLKVELTETAIIDNPDQVKYTLGEVQKLNVKTALDDFGTGYCSLIYLHYYPFDTLKIDQLFIKDIDKRQKNRAIVHSTITLAHKLGMDVIAEGIETENEAQTLQNMGCKYGQGMFYNPPLPVEDAEKLLLRNGP